MEIFQISSILGLAIVLTIKEIFNSNGRSRLHSRINKLDEKFTSQKMCDERSGNIEEKLDYICEKLDKITEGPNEK